MARPCFTVATGVQQSPLDGEGVCARWLTPHTSLYYHSFKAEQGGGIILWKLHSTEDDEAWKIHKTLLFHHKDVLELQWSHDSAFLVSASVGNTLHNLGCY